MAELLIKNLPLSVGGRSIRKSSELILVAVIVRRIVHHFALPGLDLNLANASTGSRNSKTFLFRSVLTKREVRDLVSFV